MRTRAMVAAVVMAAVVGWSVAGSGEVDSAGSNGVAAVDRIVQIATDQEAFADGADTLARVAAEARSPQVRRCAAFAASRLYLKAGDTKAAMNVLAEYACLEDGSEGPAPGGLAFRRIADMNVAHSNGGMAVVKGKIYVVGGYTHVGSRNNDYTTTLERYDPVTDRWTKLASCPVRRQGMSFFELGGKVYLVGGEGGSSGHFSGQAYCYDPQADRWSAAVDFPTNAWDTDAVVIGDTVHLFGGRTGYGATLRRHYVLNRQAGSWERREAPPVSQMLSAPVVVNGKIWLIGGYHKTSERSNDVLDCVQIYDPQGETWKRKRLPESLAMPAAFVMDGKVWLTGLQKSQERGGKYAPVDCFFIYDPATGAWSKVRVDVPDHLRMQTQPVVIGRSVYFVDALDPSNKKARYGRLKSAWVLRIPRNTRGVPVKPASAER